MWAAIAFVVQSVAFSVLFVIYHGLPTAYFELLGRFWVSVVGWSMIVVPPVLTGWLWPNLSNNARIAIYVVGIPVNFLIWWLLTFLVFHEAL